MRNVAIALAALTLIAALPTVLSADECAAAGSGSLCIPIAATRPTSPPGVPQIPNEPFFGTYYLWLGAGHCTTFDLNDCRSVGANRFGFALPNEVGGGRTPGVGIFGLLYQETNGAPGLQRYFTTRLSDTMVLT